MKSLSIFRLKMNSKLLLFSTFVSVVGIIDYERYKEKKIYLNQFEKDFAKYLKNNPHIYDRSIYFGAKKLVNNVDILIPYLLIK
jgi:hypothetical protein